jgi:oxygen-independent coproporphyrinogen III oxidase
MSYSLYVHIPFCQHRCHYCDFNTFAGKENLIPAYVNAVNDELHIVKNHLPNVVLDSVYFGGGTPSLISAYFYQSLLATIGSVFAFHPDCEISLEANPGTLSASYLSHLHGLGFNRISIGVQSTDTFDLLRLDRTHSIGDILKAVHFARKAGFDNISLDLIFNLPWQNLSSWEHSLKRAIDLAPEHFSLYALIIEPGTALSNWYQKGLIAPQDQDLEADMYERAIELLELAGYEQYEISNWAKKDTKDDFRCRHNLQYWFNLPYIGVGAGAHGYLGNVRTENVVEIESYLRRFRQDDRESYAFPETPATIHTEMIDRATQMRDFMWLGLRLVKDGISEERFYHSFGSSMRATFKDEIDELLNLGLIEWGRNDHTSLHLTRRGVMLANQVFMRFV